MRHDRILYGHRTVNTFGLSTLRRAGALAQEALDVRGHQFVVVQQMADVHVVVGGHVPAGARGQDRRPGLGLAAADRDGEREDRDDQEKRGQRRHVAATGGQGSRRIHRVGVYDDGEESGKNALKTGPGTNVVVVGSIVVGGGACWSVTMIVLRSVTAGLLRRYDRGFDVSARRAARFYTKCVCFDNTSAERDTMCNNKTIVRDDDRDRGRVLFACVIRK